MEQLNEYKGRLMEQIDSTPNKSLSLGALQALDRKHKDTVQRSLEYLDKENYLTKEVMNGFTIYSIKNTNYTLPTFKAVCPKCHTVKKIYYPNQVVTECLNNNCKTIYGKPTRFFLRKTKLVYDMSKFVNLYQE